MMYKSLVILLVAITAFIEAAPAPQTFFQAPQRRQSTAPRFLPPLRNPNSDATKLALVGTALPIAFAGIRFFQNPNDVHIQPNLGVNVDPNTGKLRPSASANLQFGSDSLINPTINVGGQFDPESGHPLPIAPTIGSGVNIGNAQDGSVTGNVGSNVAFSNGGASTQFGGSVGAFGTSFPGLFSSLGRR